ncbi:zinc ribbon domain protein [Moorella thermoacetica]|uniref:FmdB family zinc ribbon protein n=1 Tax=Neomoorella thermoacetica TaxID=1525 RepID=UPI0006A30B90|nr:FmdB family zinc ribbon protein [Moorella thermoacetica]AKX93034.1 zinc ribbon domain protein [Moorella thermoacetica]
MPVYEYRCAKCGVFEKEQRITAPPLMECPTCGGPVHRIISRNIGVIYKAGGFYTTENRSQEYKNKAKEESKTSEVSKAS